LRPGDIRLIPDLNYKSRRPTYKTDVDDRLRRMLRLRRNLFIWSETASRYPPVLLKIEAGPAAAKYFVDITRGGPGMVLTLPACYRRQGKILHLAPGLLTYPREWWNPEADRWEEPSTELKLAYRDIRRRIKSQLVRHRLHVYIWTGQDALLQILEKKAQVHGFGLD
jgi:hypothetical protein